ncbi:hypothetical protein HYU19_01580 [Candidatus Woesearchaeota archaeon]|nr:hypothetical protein [Candidatus Woesearchaeota archaeon]
MVPVYERATTGEYRFSRFVKPRVRTGKKRGALQGPMIRIDLVALNNRPNRNQGEKAAC